MSTIRMPNVKICLKRIDNAGTLTYQPNCGEILFNIETNQILIWNGTQYRVVETTLFEPPEITVDAKDLEGLL